MCKQQAQYCSKCGGYWEDVQEATYHQEQSWGGPAGPWRRQAERGWESPRQRIQSPRRRAKGKDTKEPSKGPGKGAKGKEQAAPRPQAPDVSQLPAAPARVPTSMPKPPEEPSTGSSEDRKALEMLVAHISTAGGDVPDSIASLVSQYKTVTHKQEGRQLHQLVARQTQAKRELARIETERANYDKAWVEYIDRLTQLIQNQFAAREQAVREMDESAEAWTGQLRDSSRALAESAGSSETKQDMEVEDAEAIVTAAVEEESQRRQAAEATQRQHYSVIEALRQARATVVSAVRREGSRTPRRKKDKDNFVDSSPELEPQEPPQDGAAAKLQSLPSAGDAAKRPPR